MPESPYTLKFEDHPEWPKPGEHLWSRWQAKTGLPKPTQYRTCLHPNCKAVEEREWPKS